MDAYRILTVEDADRERSLPGCSVCSGLGRITEGREWFSHETGCQDDDIREEPCPACYPEAYPPGKPPGDLKQAWADAWVEWGEGVE